MSLTFYFSDIPANTFASARACLLIGPTATAAVSGSDFALTLTPYGFGGSAAISVSDTTGDLPYFSAICGVTNQTTAALNNALAAGGTNVLAGPTQWGFVSNGATVDFTPGDRAVGVALSPTGLDQLSAAVPTNTASTFATKLMQLWARFFVKSTLTASGTTGTLTTFAGTSTATTQALSDDGTTQTVGPA